MASVVHISFILILFTGSYVSCVDADLKKYVPLISDIREYYRTSRVLFVFSGNNPRMEEYTTYHFLTRTFSKEGVYTLIANYVKLNEYFNSYRKQIDRPLIVVLLKSVDDIAEFNKNTRELNKLHLIWLVIFNGDSSNSLCEYCSQPKGNMFNLRFDSLMVLVCCEKPTLQEWSSVHENTTKVNDFGTWTTDQRLKILAIDGLNARRNSVDGAGLRIVVVSTSSFVHDYGDRIGGLFGDVLYDLKRAMNFTITEIHRVETFGSYDSTTKSWSGAIGVLVRGEADLAIGDFAITSSRAAAIDLTNPSLTSETQLYIRKPYGSDVKWSAYFQAFTLQIWFVIIVLVIITPLLLAVMTIIGKKISWLSRGIDNYLRVWGAFCQQGLFEYPTETPLRIVYISIFVTSLVVSTAYSASLISFITLPSTSLGFSTLDGFVKDGSYKLIVYKDNAFYDIFASSNDSTFVQMMRLMKPWKDLPHDTSKGWEQVCNERVALYSINVEGREINIPCDFVGIGTGLKDNLALALPAGSQYTRIINYHLKRFKTSGIFNRRKEKYFRKQIPTDTSEYKEMNFRDVTPVLTALAGGIILALIVLLCEKMYYSVNSNGRYCFRKQRSPLKNVRRPLRLRTRNKFDMTSFGYYP